MSGLEKSEEVWSVVYRHDGELSCHQNQENITLN